MKWHDSLGGAELLEAAQVENEPETELDAQTMRAFSADNLGLKSKVDVQPLGDTMAVSPVLPGESAPAAESLGNENGYNVILITDKNDLSNTSAYKAERLIKNDGHTATYDYASNFIEPSTAENNGLLDIAFILDKSIEELYDPSKENYIFIIFNESNIEINNDSIFATNNATAYDLQNRLNDLSSNKPHISIVSNLSSFSELSYLSRIIDETDGVVINTSGYKNSDEIALEIYNIILGTAEFKYISSVGLTEMPAVFNTKYLSKIYNDRTESGDYDNDLIRDCDEIAFNAKSSKTGNTLIKYNENKTIKELPTIYDCMYYVEASYGYVFVKEAFDRYIDELHEEENVYSFTSIIRSTKIVPIDSDPILTDGDYDGILDFDEFEWNGIDTRYENISPLMTDTVESLYDDLTDKDGLNLKGKPIYLDIKGNHIKIHYQYKFTAFDRKYPKEDLLKGAEFIWSHSYEVTNYETNDRNIVDHFKGKLYDFYPGMIITVELIFEETNDNSIKFNYYNENSAGGTITGSYDEYWFNNSNTYIDIYIKENDGDVVDAEEITYVFSHELGHTFGLWDAYGSANNEFEIYTDYDDPNLEFPFINKDKRNTFEAGEIMVLDGLPSSNDIEMILQAFVEERSQWFYFEPTIYPGYEVSISKAIKNPVIIYEKAIEVFINSDGEIETIAKKIPSYHVYKQYENKKELEEFSYFDLEDYI